MGDGYLLLRCRPEVQASVAELLNFREVLCKADAETLARLKMHVSSTCSFVVLFISLLLLVAHVLFLGVEQKQQQQQFQEEQKMQQTKPRQLRVEESFRRLEDKGYPIQASGKAVYLLRNKMKYHIPDWDTFIGLGFGSNDVHRISDEEMNSYPTGNSIDAIFEEGGEDTSPICPCESKSRTAVANAERNHSKPHVICFINNEPANTFFKMYEHQHMHISHKYISDPFDSSSSSSSSGSSGGGGGGNSTEKEAMLTSCDVFVRITQEKEVPNKHLCPGVCLPRPYVVIPLVWLTGTISHSLDVTCSLRVGHIFEKEGHEERPVESAELKKHEHMSLGVLFRAIARRRIEECNEKEFWTKGEASAVATKGVVHHKDPPKRVVHGLIIWIAANDRIALARQQIEVLKDLPTNNPNTSIVGWLASEDIYPCKLLSTLCTSLDHNSAYHGMMPSSKLNMAAANWGCAQRRPLRALAHTLALFDPNYILLGDDDTYVAVMPGMALAPYSKLDEFIRTRMANEPIALGSLTLGRKVTKKGFFYGGAGYLIGKAVIERLTSHELMGPVEYSTGWIDPSMMQGLQVFGEAWLLSNQSCPEQDRCFLKVNNNVDGSTSALGLSATLTVPVIDVCANLFADEHTCYHSDHSMTRCLVHAAYTIPNHISCQGTHLQGTEWMVGMCMEVYDWCHPDYQITCHRWMPDPLNITNTVIYNETLLAEYPLPYF